MPLKLTPHAARLYLLGAALLIAFPSLLSLYSRYSGKMIVALGRADRDPNFAQTVVYIAGHSGWGAHGLIINKPIGIQERAKLPNLPPDFDFYVGGPVMYPWAQYVLLPENQGGKPRLKMMSLPEYVKQFPEEWKQIQQDRDKRSKFKIYLGFSGWGTAQLEREILWGGWGTVEYEDKFIDLMGSPEDLWRAAMKKLLEKSPEKQQGI